jgi:hypothetical protein
MQAVDCGTCTCRGSNQALSDVEVVRRVRDGETALFEILMRRYNRVRSQSETWLQSADD